MWARLRKTISALKPGARRPRRSSKPNTRALPTVASSKASSTESTAGNQASRAGTDSKPGAWLKDGKLKVEEDAIDGLENTPAALIGLLAGENRGKRMVKV